MRRYPEKSSGENPDMTSEAVLQEESMRTPSHGESCDSVSESDENEAYAPPVPKKKPTSSGSKRRKKRKNTSGRKKSKSRKRKKQNLLPHLIFAGIVLIILLVIGFKLIRWNIGTHMDTTADNAAQFDTESMDNIVPVDSSNQTEIVDDGELNIVFFGNGQLAEDKSSPGNLANRIAAKTGANVSNFAIDGSSMSAKNDHYKDSWIYDAFSFYYVTAMYTVNSKKTADIAIRDMNAHNYEIKEDVQYLYDTLWDVDFSKVDVICINYDSTEYQEQRRPYIDGNTSDVNTFAGALEAGIQLIKQTYPHIRIIVLSPTFVYYGGKDGKPVSCYDETIVKWPFYIYIIHEQDTCYVNNVTFVDNFYGTIYGENADQYLIDNTRLNQEGIDLIADRFIYALNRFNDYDFSAYEGK